MNGKLWEVGRSIIVAAIVGLIVMYGTVGKLGVKFDMLYAQVSSLTGIVNGHITNYEIHVPHKDFEAGKSIGLDFKEDKKR